MMNEHDDGKTIEWLSVHMRCDSDIDLFLTDGLFPVLDDLCERFEDCRYFFIRYWMSGAHIRLRVQIRRDLKDEFATALVDAAEKWLKAQTVVNPHAEGWYRRIAPELARRERENGTLPAWAPHGSVWAEPYIPEINKYGKGLSLDGFERQFCSSSVQAKKLLSERPGRAKLVSLVTMLMYRTWSDTRLRMGPEWVPRETLVERWSPSATAITSNGLRLTISPEQFSLFAEQQQADGIPEWQAEWGDSLTALTNRLSSIESSQDDQRYDVFDSRDHCVHLMCNRLGVTIEQEHAAREFAYEAVRRSMNSGVGGSHVTYI